MPSRKIAPPPVTVRVWVRVKVSFRVREQFSSEAIVLEPIYHILLIFLLLLTFAIIKPYLSWLLKRLSEAAIKTRSAR